MKSLHRLAFVSIAIFYSMLASAQSLYKPGFVVTNSGDTIQGWIDYRQWERNPDAIRFRNTVTAEKHTSYAVTDLSYFEITGLDRYERAVVMKDIRPVEMNQLEKSAPDTTVSDTVFLRLLLKAKLSLYELVDSKPHYYIREEGQDYQELLYKVYLVDYNTKLSKVYIFRDQLKQWIPASKNEHSLSSILDNSDYDEKDLIRILEKINELVGDQIAYKVKKQKNSLSWYAGAGTVYSAMSVKGNEPNISRLDYTSSFQPMLTAGVDVGVMRNLQRLLLRFELAWYSLKYEGTSKPNTTDSVSFKLKINNITPSVSVLYNLMNYPNHKLYIGTGLSYNFSSYPENRLVKRYGSTSTIRTLEELEMQKSWISFHAKAGYLINKKIEIATALRLGGGFSNYSNFSLSPSIVFANINYHF